MKTVKEEKRKCALHRYKHIQAASKDFQHRRAQADLAVREPIRLKCSR